MARRRRRSGDMTAVKSSHSRRLAFTNLRPTTTTCLFYLLLLVAAASNLQCASATINNVGFHYEAPSDCQWTLMNSSESSLSSSLSSSSSSSGGGGGNGGIISGSGVEVSLHCRLRTINSQFDQTNFSVVPREHTTALTIECSDSLLYQSFLHPHSFAHLHHLRQLTIEYCKLGQLSRGVLHGLRDLRSLAIRSHNDVWPAINLELSRDSLVHDVEKLERLDLSCNNIATFRHSQLLCDLASLQVLNVSRNRLTDLAVDLGLTGSGSGSSGDNEQGATGYCTATSLTLLDASYNHLVSLGGSSSSSSSSSSSGGNRSLLAPLRHLRILKLDHNRIERLADGALDALTDLEQLSLSVNKIDRLPQHFFASVASLRELNLSNNSLTQLPQAVFASQRHLEVLLLAWNRLNDVATAPSSSSDDQSSSWFDNLVRLVVLDLSHNAIVRIRRNLFKDLYSLQVLRLEWNQIESIEAASFASLSNLHTLQLANNRLAFIESSFFNGLLVLNQLRLEGNAIVGMDAETFRNCSNIEELHLQDNRLERVPASSFKSLTLLKTLDLSRNKIRFLNATALRGLKNLVHLRLAGNQIKTIRQASLPPLALLKSLDLSSSSLQTVERGALDGLTGLESLWLNSNNLSSLENVVVNLPRLLRLNVSDNDLRWFDYAVLPIGLQWLDLHKNQVEELGNYLRLEAQLKLEVLDASYNRIAALSSASLPHSLRQVTLSDNQIAVIEPNTFADKASLSRVDLYANQLVTLNLNALRLNEHVPVLPEFYLGGNPFQCDCDMEWLQRINALNNAGQYPRAMDLDSIYCRLSYGRGSRSVTPLVEASSSDFLCPYRTHCFALCHCCDFDACDCEMTCPSNCSCYHDQSWSTNVVDCSGGSSNNKKTSAAATSTTTTTTTTTDGSAVPSSSSNDVLTDIPSRIPMDATDVYLDGNQLGQLSNHAFIGKKNLRTLLLNSSSISSLHNHTFSGLKRLLVLHLDRNRLTQLTGYEFEPLESLRELYLQHNRIAAIHEKTFSHLRSLQILRLDGNQLVTYDVAQLAANPYLRIVFLAGNPLSCECQFVRPFRQWLLQSNHRIQIEDQDSVVCWPLAQPILTSDNTSDTCPEGSIRLLNPNLNPMMQSDEWWLLMAATFSAALVVLFVGLCLCCCRRQLRLFLFSQCGLRTCYRGEPTDDADKPFDALLVYSAKDDLLVRDSIVGRLERKNYQLCLQHNRTAHHHHHQSTQHHDDDRDLSAAAAASRRLVIILTKSFIETEWGKANVRALLRSTWQPSSSSSGQQQRVVILLPEPRIVREIDADLDLHLLLKHSQLVEWNRRFCWSRLLLALPPPRSCPGALIIPVAASSSFGGGGGSSGGATSSVRDYCGGTGSGHQFAVTSSSPSSSLMSTPVFSSSMTTTTTLLQSAAGGGGSRQQQQHHNQHRLIHQQRQLPTVPETI